MEQTNLPIRECSPPSDKCNVQAAYDYGGKNENGEDLLEIRYSHECARTIE